MGSKSKSKKKTNSKKVQENNSSNEAENQTAQGDDSNNELENSDITNATESLDSAKSSENIESDQEIKELDETETSETSETNESSEDVSTSDQEISPELPDSKGSGKEEGEVETLASEVSPIEEVGKEFKVLPKVNMMVPSGRWMSIGVPCLITEKDLEYLLNDDRQRKKQKLIVE